MQSRVAVGRAPLGSLAFVNNVHTHITVHQTAVAVQILMAIVWVTLIIVTCTYSWQHNRPAFETFIVTGMIVELAFGGVSLALAQIGVDDDWIMLIYGIAAIVVTYPTIKALAEPLAGRWHHRTMPVPDRI
jgi:hypothetical protein